jgi:uncharacterized repeat protein (TIGR01451 family)
MVYNRKVEYMFKSKVLFIGVVAAMVMAGSQVASAWNPAGVVSKKVQNVTQSSAISEADNVETAVQVKTGDVIRYTITVTNAAGAAFENHNDLAFIKVTDQIPAGLELISSPSVRTIAYDVKDLKPGESDIRTFDLKVTSSTHLQVITNEACFSGDSAVKDKPQSGCNKAVIKVVVPQTSSTSTTKPVPVVQAATTMPKTGVGNVFIAGFTAGLVGYAASLVLQKRKLNTN